MSSYLRLHLFFFLLIPSPVFGMELSLSEAAFHGNEEKVVALLKAGTSVNNWDESDYPPLHSAAYWGYQNIVRALLATGASVDKTDYSDRTALHQASWGKQNTVVKTLLAAGANPIPLFKKFTKYHKQYAQEREKYLSVKREKQWHQKRLLLIAHNKENPDETPLASLPTEILKHIWKFGLHTFSKQEWDEWQQFKEKNPKIKKLAHPKTLQSILKNISKKIFGNK